MLGVARRHAEIERVPNAAFLHADAQLHPFPAESFDVVVSRHGTMFFGDPVAAFRNLARALRPVLVDHHLAGGVYYESAAWLVEARRP
jgi:ubiquinone/menaquinone biosynthesis C-methylase UbiE